MAPKQDEDAKSIRFTVPMPGGKVARVPVDVLNRYIQTGGKAVHAESRGGSQALAGPPGSKSGAKSGSAQAPGHITINIYATGDGVSVRQDGGTEQQDVVAHSLSVDATTGASEWHTDWEFGECDYTDESGFTSRIQAWHRHPYGTEYTEIFEG